SNIAVGSSAGSTLTTGVGNIDIGNPGIAGESSTIRIGSVQTRAFLAGVRGRTTGVADGLTVLIDSNGQLGTVSSSARVKRDIAGMGEQSSALMKLRPVSFFYRSDAVGIRQYGLIAEEVAEVMPELVQFSPAGEAETVRYHFLAPLLLNQVQKQNRQIEEQQKTIDALNTTLDVLGQRLQALERQTVRSQ
ncbi:MAG: tail fiber domain-containing protein, partial [Acidimicrobiia bacterium]